ncbi:MAG TPA: FAD-binding dehydrogenase, partial [Gemmatimonadaceae bacterium]|nr:FAD-binding dehydrogenase [Gemmatimonadaceae bacterium]
MADADVIVVGAGLAGLVAACELARAKKRVIVVDQEPAQSLGGQAHWSLGGFFMIDTPEQRRLRIRDSFEVARHDWLGAAAFDRADDVWPRKWADAYLEFAAGEKRAWLHSLGVRWFPIVGWAERARNSLPRFHVTWGTGPGVLAPFIRMAREAERTGSLELRFRHRVDELATTGGVVNGVRGCVLAPSDVPRGVTSSRDVIGTFELRADAVIVASGGIGGDHELVRRMWPARLGAAPATMVQGVPDSIDGRMLGIVARAGGRCINGDRMWHYTEGVQNWAPVWTNHGIRILPGPSSLWLDASGNRLPAPLFPGFDTLDTLEHIRRTGADYTWFVLNQHIIRKEFALSGSEQNPDLTGRSIRLVLGRAFGKRAMAPVEKFKAHGRDFIVARTVDELVARMNTSGGSHGIARADIERAARELHAPGDPQMRAILDARRYLGDRISRVAKPKALFDASCGPLIAVKLHVLTRKSLGGCETDLDCRVLGANGTPVPGLHAVGEAAGFGGGG